VISIVLCFHYADTICNLEKKEKKEKKRLNIQEHKIIAIGEKKMKNPTLLNVQNVFNVSFLKRAFKSSEFFMLRLQ